jgi:hypothetical protein
MTLLVPWLAFPLVLGALCLGAGLGLERAGGRRLPASLLLPAGIVSITVLASFTTQWPATAPLTVPAVVALAVVGFGLTDRPPATWLDPYATAAAATAFLATGAPVLASGKATFSGYVKLDDTATFLALTDRAFEHGRDLHGLAPSSYEATLWVNLAHGYPVGSLLPFGAASRMVQTDGAWVFQPYLMFLAALVALGIYALVGDVIPSRGWRALAAVAASQSALLYGFALWGGVKELYAAAVLPFVAATVLRVRDDLRAAVVPAAGAAALLTAASVGAAVWLIPAALAVLLVPARGRAVPTFALTLLLALPAVLQAGEFLRGDNRASFHDSSELGNLLRPLSPLQVLGIWPSADFRTTPHAHVLTAALLGLALALTATGLVVGMLQRAWPMLVCAACAACGAGLISGTGSPWLSGKALAIAAPTVTALALVGAMRGRIARGAAPVLTATLMLGVASSDALAAHSASLAPRDQLVELETIGTRFAGQGPALMTEYQPYGVRHFLRRLDAEGAGELRRRPLPLLDGRLPGKGEAPDLDSIDPSALDVYRTIVLRREQSPSRPSARYALAWSGRFYEVWQRLAVAPAVLQHLPLGADGVAASPAPCARVLRLAARARRAGGVVAARRGDRAETLPPLFVRPERARSLCGRTLDWVEAVRPASG